MWIQLIKNSSLKNFQMQTSKLRQAWKFSRWTILFSTVFNENDFKKITQNAKDNAYKTVNQDRLRNEGRKQLLENLNNIFVLAKALNYKIEDQTGQIDTSKL